MPITLEIVTPDAKVFSEEVDQVIVPTSNGKIGVLPHHVPVIDKLVAGDLKVIKDGQTEYLAVGSGFVEVYSEKVSVLTDEAIQIGDRDESDIEEAVKRAQQALEEAKTSNYNVAQIEKLEAAARFAHAQKIAKSKAR
ncbi:MAG: ATP synthase F1 subunit epsilon [Verrucomicrobiota bacterium]|nr:ATP synthase F1 subunit epsilon [Verrucomicrobiota bacterium]